MLKVEKLIEDIVNDIYRNSNDEDLINKKIHLSTDLDKLLYHSAKTKRDYRKWR